MENTKYQNILFSSLSSFHRLLFYGLFVANLLSIIYFIMLGYYNRLAIDDYCYQTAQNEYGFFSPFTFWYQNYQGRFAPQFFINLTTKIFGLTNTLLPFTILFLILFTWVIYKLLKKIAPALSNFELLNLGIFVFSLVVINNYEFNTFFWLNASAMYFGGVLFLLIGINEILSSKKNLLTYLLIIFCGVYVGSSSETFALIWSILAGLSLIFFASRFKFDYRMFVADIHFKKLIVAFICCSISLIAMYLAPGNDVRLKITAINMHQQIPLPLHKLYPAAINAFIVFGSNTVFKLPFWVLLSLPFFYIGIYLKDTIPLYNKVINIKLLSLCFGIFLLICLIPTVYMQGDIGPKRALTHVACYIAFYVVIFSFVTGLKLKLNQHTFLWVAVISIAFWIFIIIGRLKNEIPDVKRYAHSEDIRIAYLKSFENRGLYDTTILTYPYQPVSDLREHLKLFAQKPLNKPKLTNSGANKILDDTLELTPLYLPVSSDVSEHLKLFIQKALNKRNLNNSIFSKSLGQNHTHYILMPNEIRPAPQDFVNDCICNALHLEFHLKLKN